MHIGMISYDYDPPIGGLGIHVQRLLQGLRNSGIAVDVVSPSAASSSDIPQIVRKRWNKKGGSPLFSLWLHYSMTKLIARHQWNLVHAHAGSGGVFLTKNVSIPLVLTVHHTYHAEALSHPKGSLTQWRKKLLMKKEKKTYDNADQIMCVSADTKQELIDVYGIDEGKLIVVENSIPLPQQSAVSRDPQTILFAGRLEPRKGIDVLLNAFPIVRKEFPDARLDVIGNNLLGDALQKLPSDGVTFHGHVNDNTYEKHFQTATMLCVPSRQEGFGLVAAEAMAHGLPVVASGAPGLRSIITHEKTGLLFPSEHSEACAASIIRLLRNQELSAQLSSAAQKEARERFSLERQVQETLAVYKTSLS